MKKPCSTKASHPNDNIAHNPSNLQGDNGKVKNIK